MMSFLRIFKSQIAHYVGIRYFAYGLQFINSILVAKYLGVYYFGIYCFLFLVIQYVNYAGMAPTYSLNAILSTKKAKIQLPKLILGNSLLMSAIITTMISMFCLLVVNIFPLIFIKYLFNEYVYYVIGIFVLASFNSLFINLYRSYGQLKKININQLIVPLTQTVVLLCATEKELLTLLLIGTVLSNLLSLIIFLIQSPLKINFCFQRIIFRALLKRGFNLLIFNVSFYLILLSSRTIVSIYYRAEELGFYTLAVNLSNAVFMLIGSFSFVLFPKLLFKFSNFDKVESKHLLNEIRSIYVTGCYLLTFAGFFLIPLLIYILPHYKDSLIAFKILLLTQLILNNNFGYSIVLIANKKESLMATNALITMVIVICISVLLIWLNLMFYTLAMAVAIGFLFYCLRITYQALVIIESRGKMVNVLKELFPTYFFIPFLILITGIVLNDNYYTPIISMIFFLILNWENVINAIIKTKLIISDKSILNF